MKLRKWQSNSKELLETDPKNLREKTGCRSLQIINHDDARMRIMRNTDSDTWQVSVTSVVLNIAPTK